MFDMKEHKLGDRRRYAPLIPHIDSVYGLLLLKSVSVCYTYAVVPNVTHMRYTPFRSLLYIWMNLF